MRRVPPEMFRFTTAEKADLNGAVLDAFGVAGEHLETTLSPDAVRERLRLVGWVADVDDGELHDALLRLMKWELLDVVHNHAENYRTAEEYERRNLQYSLTRRGEAALAGVRHALEVLASTGALQTAVLEAIADRLDDLCLLSGEPASADRRIFRTLRELEAHLEALVENTKAFNGELQSLLRAEGADFGGLPRGQGRHCRLFAGVPGQPRPARTVGRRRGPGGGTGGRRAARARPARGRTAPGRG